MNYAKIVKAFIRGALRILLCKNNANGILLQAHLKRDLD